MLNDFVIQYDKAVVGRRRAKEDEDFYIMNSTTALTTVYPIEKQEVSAIHKNCLICF